MVSQPAALSPAPAASAGRSEGVVVRKVTFAVLLVLFVLFTVFGLREFQFDETQSNGAIICISCIGVG